MPVQPLSEVLAGIFKGNEDIPISPLDGIGLPKNGERPIGSLTDPTVKRLLVLDRQIKGQALALAEEHKAFHDTKGTDPELCKQVHATLDSLKIRSILVRRLFWEGVGQEFPSTLHPDSDASIRDKWTIAVPSEFTEGSPFQDDPDHISSQLFAKIGDIFRKDPVGPFPDMTGEVDGDAGEEIVGVVSDPRTKALSGLVTELGVARRALVPSTVNDEAALGSWMDEQTIGGLKSVAHRLQLLDHQFELVSDLRFELVREEFPTIRNAPAIGLRKGWVVVKMNQPPIPIMLRLLVEALSQS